MTYTLPPPLERLVGFTGQQVLFELVRFESQQILIADLPVQFRVLNRAFERLLELLGIGLPSPLVQQTRAKLSLELIPANLTTIDQPKEHAVGYTIQ
jgi:hypothetical protein